MFQLLKLKYMKKGEYCQKKKITFHSRNTVKIYLLTTEREASEKMAVVVFAHVY